MPFEPDVLNYFLVILGGFGAVWAFRKTRGNNEKLITEFEYAAFSTIWGIPVFFAFVWLLRNKNELLTQMFKTPMSATPSLFILGAAGGIMAAKLWGFVGKFLNRFEI